MTVVNIRVTFINIVTFFPTFRVPFFTLTLKWPNCVSTDGIDVTVMHSCCTFIHILTFFAGAGVSDPTMTLHQTKWFYAVSFGMALVLSVGTFVHDFAICSITAEPCHTLTLKWSLDVFADCIDVALMCVWCTLIDIRTRCPSSWKSAFAWTFKRPLAV